MRISFVSRFFYTAYAGLAVAAENKCEYLGYEIVEFAAFLRACDRTVGTTGIAVADTAGAHLAP